MCAATPSPGDKYKVTLSQRKPRHTKSKKILSQETLASKLTRLKSFMFILTVTIFQNQPKNEI